MRYFQLVYPEQRIVSETVIASWYRDRFGEEEEDRTTVDEMVETLVDIGYIDGQWIYDALAPQNSE